MKLKVSLDKNALQQFFLGHVEKMVFAGIMMIFGLIVWRAYGIEGFNKTPEQLRTATDNAKRHVEETPADETGLKAPPDYVALASRSRNLIGGEPYAQRMKWNPAIFQPLRLRTKPPAALGGRLAWEG